MDKGIFAFILRFSKRQQVMLLIMIVASYPFYYFSLDLPKTIINEAISGSDFPKFIFGYDLTQLDYLLALCFAFLCLVLVNGGFKYFINVYRGVVGERMLRRLRYVLINRVMRFPLPHFRNISEGEVVSMVTAETEPLGGFVGESISLPAFQGGMLITALIFMFVQDPILGIAAIALYPVQAWGIPKLQRKVNLLNKERVQHVRKLSERVNELVAGAAEIHAHDTSQYELADFSSRLGAIFRIRYQVYQKKFFIKFLNNFLAQVTPFFFYSIGGYLVIAGDLSIGALVAILAAYKDLAPPWKELLNFYQRMEDARIKYTQLVERFDPPRMYSEDIMAASATGGDAPTGQITASSLTLEEDEGSRILENAGFAFGMNEHVAITGQAGGPKSAVARLIARQVSPDGGTLSIDGRSLATIPEYVTGRQFGYVDQDAYIRSGTIRDNLFYGLKHYPRNEPADSHEAIENRREAALSGNSVHAFDSDWLDTGMVRDTPGGAPGSLAQCAMDALRAVDLEQDVLAIGIHSTIDPEAHPELVKGVLRARGLVQERMKSREFHGLVETWDRTVFNHNASVAENILFGTPADDTFNVEELGHNDLVLAALDKAGLRDKFMEMGRSVASLMVELFHDLPPGHEFFERFSFIDADDLPEFQAILAAPGMATDDDEALNDEQRDRLLQLPFRLVPAQHRLGLIDEEVEERLLVARKAFADDLPDHMRSSISFFEPETYNHSSQLLDNALFGKIDSTRPDSAEKIRELVTGVFDELDLRLPILETGLNFEVGISGRRLSVPQRQKLAIARNLVKNPQLFIVNEATGVLDSGAQSTVFAAIKSAMADRGLVWVDGEIPDTDQFDRVFLAEAGKVRETTGVGGAVETVEPAESPAQTMDIQDTDPQNTDAQDTGDVDTDADLLSGIPFFAGLDRSRLKLLAFTSERQTLEPQENLIEQGESGDVAFVIVDGTVSVITETSAGRVKISDIGRGGVIGELALLCEAPRTATVQANERLSVLKIDKEVFMQLIEDSPAVGASLSHILAAKLEGMMRSMNTHHDLYDPVSSLPNRNLFMDYMKTTMSQDKRDDTESSVVLLDFDQLDGLDLLRDNLARQHTVLSTIATRIKPVVRAADSFGRLAGHRFGIIVRGLGVERTSELLPERIDGSLGEPLPMDTHTIDLKAMCHVEVLPLNDETLRALKDQV